jgi:hypothetical protein
LERCAGAQWRVTDVASLTELTSVDLLAMYADIMRELRQRGIVRSANNPVADLAELLASRAFGLKLQKNSTAGSDGVAPDGTRYQVKGRRRTPENRSTQLSTIRNLGSDAFDYVLAVLFDEHFGVERALRIPREAVQQYARYSSHVNGHILRLVGPVLDDQRTEDVTARIRAVRL